MSAAKDLIQPEKSSNSELLAQNEQLRAHNEQLKAQLMNASMINELTKVLHSCTDLDNIYSTILLAIQELLEFDRVMLFNIKKENFSLVPEYWVGFSDTEVIHLSVPLGFEGGDITDALFLNRHIIVEEPDPDEDLFYRLHHSESYLVIPLVSKLNRTCRELKSCTKTSCPAHGGFNPYCWSIMGAGQLLNTRSENDRRQCCISCKAFKADGVFWMDRVNNNKEISSDDITQLTTIINMAGLVIDNFRIMKALDTANSSLHKANQQLQIVNQDLQVAQSRIQNDLEHARSIQQGLLGYEIKNTSSFSVGAKYLSADAVGGDYYDVFEIRPDVYGLVVADVSGHGIASALIMSMAKVLLKTFSQNETSPQKTLERINQTFLSEIRTDHFVTIFYAILDTSAKVIRYTSAGHCPIPFIDKIDNTFSMIKADGLFLGVFPDMMLSEKEISYTPGRNRMVLYTDGLVEGQDKDEKMYGVDKLTNIALQSIKLSAQDAVEKILNDQEVFCGSVDPGDDITLIVIDF